MVGSEELLAVFNRPLSLKYLRVAGEGRGMLRELSSSL
jgi:hypothetical protein